MTTEKIEIRPPFIKLDALLKLSGIAGTGGMAKAMIVEGEVKVDGAVCTQRGKKLRGGEIVTVGDETALEVVLCE